MPWGRQQAVGRNGGEAVTLDPRAGKNGLTTSHLCIHSAAGPGRLDKKRLAALRNGANRADRMAG